MTWVAWRRYRMEFFITLAILAGMIALLVPTGLEKIADYEDSGLRACIEADSRDCSGLGDRFITSYNSVNRTVEWFHFVPGIVGVLLAMPIVLDFDQRTYRLAWTQSISRERWFATKLAVGLAGVAAFAAVLVIVMTWW